MTLETAASRAKQGQGPGAVSHGQLSWRHPAA